MYSEMHVVDLDFYNIDKEKRDRLIVYKDLYKRGFLMTSGAKFGGDFLVYRGRLVLMNRSH